MLFFSIFSVLRQNRILKVVFKYDNSSKKNFESTKSVRKKKDYFKRILDGWGVKKNWHVDGLKESYKENK